MIDSTIHDVTKIVLGKVEKLNENSESKTYTRDIAIYKEDEKVWEVTCFAEGKDKLEIETQRTVKL